MSENRVLFVDDDPKVLSAVERRFEDVLDIEFAEGPSEAIKAVQERGPFAVVISDMRMPEMTGIEMLTSIREIAPDTVRIILTGYADLESTISAINLGNIFRFLSKPCPHDILEKAIKEGIRQYELVRSEKQLVEGTLMGSVKVLSDVLALVNPAAFGRASRVKRIAMAIARRMKIENLWEIEIASMLSALGCLTLPAATLEKLTSNGSLSDSEQRLFEQHPDIAKGLLEHIPRLENVAQIVAYQEKHFDGGGFPRDKLAGEKIPLGARILKVALDFDAKEGRYEDPVDAVVNMKSYRSRYDSNVLSSLEEVLDELFLWQPTEVTVAEIKVGMVFADHVRSTRGSLLIAKGHEVTPSALRFLINYDEEKKLQLPLKVFQVANE